MKTGQQLLTQFYSLDAGSTGLAIGTYNTGIQVPEGAIFVMPPFDLTGLNLIVAYFCLVSFSGHPDISLGTVTTPDLIYSIPGARTTANKWEINGATPINLNRIMDDTLDLIITIGASPMAAGKINGFVQYFLPA